MQLEQRGLPAAADGALAHLEQLGHFGLRPALVMNQADVNRAKEIGLGGGVAVADTLNPTVCEPQNTFDSPGPVRAHRVIVGDSSKVID
jgi:hypothetical protein